MADASNELLVSSGVQDLRGIQIARVRATYAREVDVIVRRLVDETGVSCSPQVASFSSSI